MGTEDPSRKNFPYRSAASPFSSPQSTMPFVSSPPVVGSETSPFISQGPMGGTDSSFIRPSMAPPSQTTSPFISSRPAVGPEPSNIRPMPPVRPTTPFMNPPQPSYGQTAAGPFQRAPGQLYPSTAQVPPPRTLPMGQQVSHPVSNYSAAPFTSMPVSQNPNPQSSAEASYFARPNLQQSSPPMRPSYIAPGMQPNAAAQTAPLPSASFPNHQNSYVQPPPVAPTPFLSPHRGYAPPPPGATLGPYSRDQIRAPPSSTPSLGPAQGLVEDFSSLSIGSVPGSFDPGLDSRALPRPLDGDLEPKSYAEMYPLNCNSRYLRLTTSAIPNSQSLASRWHLPLGAVVCPLAEAPNGVSNIISTPIA